MYIRCGKCYNFKCCRFTMCANETNNLFQKYILFGFSNRLWKKKHNFKNKRHVVFYPSSLYFIWICINFIVTSRTVWTFESILCVFRNQINEAQIIVSFIFYPETIKLCKFTQIGIKSDILLLFDLMINYKKCVPTYAHMYVCLCADGVKCDVGMYWNPEGFTFLLFRVQLGRNRSIY